MDKRGGSEWRMKTGWGLLMIFFSNFRWTSTHDTASRDFGLHLKKPNMLNKWVLVFTEVAQQMFSINLVRMLIDDTAVSLFESMMPNLPAPPHTSISFSQGPGLFLFLTFVLDKRYSRYWAIHYKWISLISGNIYARSFCSNCNARCE